MKSFENRDICIDYMRSVCMFLIVLAHVNPPNIIFQLRSFDVVGLIIISTMCMRNPCNLSEYLDALKRRIRRLVFPTFIAISVVLIGTYFLCLMYEIPYYYDFKTIILSYTLIDGIGYIWIVRIMLIICIASPLLFSVSKIRRGPLYGIGISLLLFCRLVYQFLDDQGALFFFIFYFVLYSIGYIVIAEIGILFKTNPQSFTKKTLCIALSILAIYKIIVSLLFKESLCSFFKHPPMLDWVLYGAIVSIILLKILYKNVDQLKRYHISGLVIWFSKNSFNVYFMHIVVIKSISFFADILKYPFINNWIVEYVFVLITSILFTIAFNGLKNALKSKRLKI